MDKLYLIRVDMERFLGPYSLKQVKEAYGRMEFGLQDEIAGSLRQWVTFDDFDSIRKHYPELVQLVQKEMLSGWGVSSHSAVGSSQLPVRVKLKPTRRSSSWTNLVLFLLVAAAGALTFLLFKEGEFSNLIGMLRDRQLYSAKSLYGERYNAKFEAFMDRNRESITNSVKRKKSGLNWLPYVRAVAFEKDGRWDGLTAKRLRGQVEGFLPQDCSMGAWEQRWNQSRDQWPRFLEGREFPKEEWAYLLVMDPHWIRHRSPAQGWLVPGSYAEACLRMAVKGMQRISGDGRGDAKVLLSRMRWQLGVINAQTHDEDIEMSGALWALSCLEDAQEEAALKNCLSSVSPRQGWREALEIALMSRKLEVQTWGRQSIDQDQLDAFKTLVNEFSSRVVHYYLPREAEVKFYQEIIQQQGSISQARSVMEQKYPLIHFEH